MIKTYIVNVETNFNPAKGRFGRWHLDRVVRVRAENITEAKHKVFCGNTEAVGRVSCLETNEAES